MTTVPKIDAVHHLVRLEFSTALLARPKVAQALAGLCLALGDEPARSGEAVPKQLPLLAEAAPETRPRAKRQRQRARRTTPRELGVAGFLADLPTLSGRFLAQVESYGVVTVAEARQQLAVSGKALGGLTGALTRWAPAYGVRLPYVAEIDADGQRCWRRIGWGEARP